MTFEEILAIEHLPAHPWRRKPEVQKMYDSLENKKVTLFYDKELRINKYPYDLADDCIHLVLWSKKPLTQEKAINYLEKKLPNKNFVAWCNARENQSVPDVFHIHVICQR
jgi:hypothetical protein